MEVVENQRVLVPANVVIDSRGRVEPDGLEVQGVAAEHHIIGDGFLPNEVAHNLRLEGLRRGDTHVHIRHKVRASVALGEDLPRPDGALKRSSINGDQAVLVVQVLPEGLRLEGVRVVGDAPELLVGASREVVGGQGVVGRGQGPVIDLVEMTRPLPPDAVIKGIDVERHGVGVQPDGVLATVGVVELLLQLDDGAGEGGHLSLVGGAVDSVEALERVGSPDRGHGVGGQPVEPCTLAGAPRPLGHAPGPGGVGGIRVPLPLGCRVCGVRLSVGGLYDRYTGARTGRGQGSEGLLV